jgi:heat shock protein 1/8
MSDESKAEACKKAGNAAFKVKDFAKAIECFTEALEITPDVAEFYSNRSAAYLKSNNLPAALADGEKCIQLKPDWVKGYARKGSALILGKEFAKAVACYAAGMAIDPEDEMLIEGLSAAQKELAKKKKKKGKKGKKAKDVDDIDAEEEKGEFIDHVIGIDLGTTYSCVGVWIDDGVVIIPTDEGHKVIPSYVSFDPVTGERLTGHAAKNQVARNPTNTIYDVKRIIGQRWVDSGVEKDIESFHYKCIKDEDGKPKIQVKEAGEIKQYFPEEISAIVLQTCKSLAEKFLKQPVTRAVVTVPAYFNDSQRNATKTAGAIAGLDVLRIINEPTAAALSYGLDNKIKKGKPLSVLIFDLGGGTFDVSVLVIESGIFTVKATGGDTRLGGEDFDHNLQEHIILEMEKAGHPSIRGSARDMQRVKRAAENCKRELSQAQSADVVLDALGDSEFNFTLAVTRQKFENLNKGPFAACMHTVTNVMKDSKLKFDAIDEIVLVGGSTRIPKLQEMLVELFNGKALCKTLNPDEAVAYGAAVQGAILSGNRNSKTDSLLLMDLTPLSLGIETTGRVMSVIIPRNTPIPVVKTQTYTTEQNYQTKVDVAVYEGERLKSDENNLLGEFTISGLEVAKRGEPQIDVSFSIDSNGILNVTAKDQKTGAKANISIQNRSKATTAQIDKMVADAEKFRVADQERIRKVESKNELEQVIFECLNISKETEDGKLANILATAAEKEQVWLEENYEDAKAAEIALRRRALSRRLEGKGGR